MSELEIDMLADAFEKIVWDMDHREKDTIITDNMVIVNTGDSTHSVAIYRSDDNPFIAVTRIIHPGGEQKSYRRTYAYDEIEELKGSLMELGILSKTRAEVLD